MVVVESMVVVVKVEATVVSIEMMVYDSDV